MTTVVTFNDLSWTLLNYGPLTTTFTPAPSCSGTSHLRLGTIDDNFPRLSYMVQCETTEWSDCAPPATITTASTSDGAEWSASAGHYYSPGLYCPSGWETVGLAGRDGDKPYTDSGVISAYGASQWVPSFPYELTQLAKGLQPSETVALCCPTGFTADPIGGCFQAVPSYPLSVVCDVYEDITRSVSKATSTYTTDGSTIKEIIRSTSTIRTTETFYETWTGGNEYLDYITPIMFVEAVTLIHHESDLSTTEKTSSGSGTATGTGSGVATGTGKLAVSTGTAASTSNAAASLTPRKSRWNGLGAVLGVSIAAAALGAAIILPF
ncbi:hypothetical protein F1880_008621 [Penicillium rolfsii]|nr:hypothetical protein F1880_008621 [Penicillium rolfsii]